MVEIRDRLIEAYSEIGYPHIADILAGKLLSKIPELAVVDREAEFPDANYIGLKYQGYLEAVEIIRDGSWVKEVTKGEKDV